MKYGFKMRIEYPDTSNLSTSVNLFYINATSLTNAWRAAKVKRTKIMKSIKQFKSIELTLVSREG